MKFQIAMQEWEMHDFEDPEGNWEKRSVCVGEDEFEKEFASKRDALKWCDENSSSNEDNQVFYCVEKGEATLEAVGSEAVESFKMFGVGELVFTIPDTLEGLWHRRCNLDSWLVLDTETTGLDPYVDEILQLAICDMNGREVWNKKYKPQNIKEWPDAQKVNNISPEDVANCPSISEDVEEITKLLFDADGVLIYNADFDLNFIWTAGVQINPVKVHDTMIDFAELYGETDDIHNDYKWQKLVMAAEFTEWPEGNFHDALADVRATAHVQKWCDNTRVNDNLGDLRDIGDALIPVSEACTAYRYNQKEK